MTERNPYTPPSAQVEDSAIIPGGPEGRKKLLPLWIKIFGWIFMVVGALIPIISIAAVVSQQPVSYELFGLTYQGSPLHPLALLIACLFGALGASAFGLLFGKQWGLQACLVTGYLGLAVCVGAMLYSIGRGSLSLRLEPLLQIPYLRKLHQLKSRWAAQSSPSGGA